MQLGIEGARVLAAAAAGLGLTLAGGTLPAATWAQDAPEPADAAEAPRDDTTAQRAPDEGARDTDEEATTTPGSPFDAESYVALSADQDAQESLGGFRRYLERTRDADEALYRVLDRRLDELESEETTADVIFWTATGLAAASLIAAIPVHETLGLDPAIGFMVAGGGVFLLGVLVQAVVRPGRGDLVELIDLHDERLGRR